MPNFWSYIKNDQYAIGCTRQTVYVYNDSNIELARFKDIKYRFSLKVHVRKLTDETFLPMFCPQHNMFVVKSTDGNGVTT